MDLISRTIAECLSRGWHAPREAITEHRIKARGGRPTTKDFLGIIDLVVFMPFASACPSTCLGIQVTSSSNHAARVKKALANKHLAYWLEANNEFQVWSWRQDKTGQWILRQQLFALKGPFEVYTFKSITREPGSQSAPPAGS